jgi:predicted small metal-binding protein
MLNEMSSKSELVQAIYETATSLHNEKAISDEVYEEIRQLCINSEDIEKDSVEEE